MWAGARQCCRGLLTTPTVLNSLCVSVWSPRRGPRSVAGGRSMRGPQRTVPSWHCEPQPFRGPSQSLWAACPAEARWGHTLAHTQTSGVLACPGGRARAAAERLARVSRAALRKARVVCLWRARRRWGRGRGRVAGGETPAADADVERARRDAARRAGLGAAQKDASRKAAARCLLGRASRGKARDRSGKGKARRKGLRWEKVPSKAHARHQQREAAKAPGRAPNNATFEFRLRRRFAMRARAERGGRTSASSIVRLDMKSMATRRGAARRAVTTTTAQAY